ADGDLHQTVPFVNRLAWVGEPDADDNRSGPELRQNDFGAHGAVPSRRHDNWSARRDRWPLDGSRATAPASPVHRIPPAAHSASPGRVSTSAPGTARASECR